VRVDGERGPDAVPWKITAGFISTAEGSVLIELGNTRVICHGTGTTACPGFLKAPGKAG